MPVFRFPKSTSGSSWLGFRENYNSLADEDDDDATPSPGSEPQNLHRPNCRRKAIIASILGIAFSSLSTVFAINLFGPISPFSEATPHVIASPCGSTPEEARSRGCHFDVISFCWLPDACYDAELSSAFDNMTTWEWFLDPEKQQPVSHQQAMTGEFTGLYVNWEYHLRHCTAIWEKLHRAILGTGKSAIDGYIGPLEHTKHCSQMLLQDRGVALETINTIILVKYPACGIV